MSRKSFVEKLKEDSRWEILWAVLASIVAIQLFFGFSFGSGFDNVAVDSEIAPDNAADDGYDPSLAGKSDTVPVAPGAEGRPDWQP